jgi:hypothetical protein
MNQLKLHHVMLCICESLELPTVAEKESASSRFQAPPSAFLHSTKGNYIHTETGQRTVERTVAL